MAKAPTKASALVVGGVPTVDLLPPEVAQRKKARIVRNRLLALVAAVLVLTLAGYGYATGQSTQAQGELESAQQRTQILLTEQLAYSDLTFVTGQLNTVMTARTVATSTEVIWNYYYTRILAMMPAGATIIAFTADGRAPWEAEPAPAGPLRQPRVATITLVVSSPTPLDSVELVSQIEGLDGFADVSPDSITSAETSFTSTFTFNVGPAALSDRFPLGEASN